MPSWEQGVDDGLESVKYFNHVRPVLEPRAVYFPGLVLGNDTVTSVLQKTKQKQKKVLAVLSQSCLLLRRRLTRRRWALFSIEADAWTEVDGKE